MPPPQSSPVPSPGVPDTGKALRLRDAGWVVPLTAQALVALFRARLAFERLEASEIPKRNAAAAKAEIADTANELRADRIGFIITRVAKRLPWRSDCVVQVIAAQEWLVRLGMASEIRIGVERPEDGLFAAHAWLVRKERIITGGDVARYSLLLGQKANLG